MLSLEWSDDEDDPDIKHELKEDEIEGAPVDSDSSLSNANQLAVRAKDSLEKKVKGRSGKHKKGSAKKGRKRQSPQGGRWR